MTNPYRNQTTPVKQKIEIQQVGPITAETTGVAAKAVVVDEKPGEVNFFDKLKGYYHTMITVIGAILVLLNEVTPITDSLPQSWQHTITLIIVGTTALLNALKSNEQWVQKL